MRMVKALGHVALAAGVLSACGGGSDGAAVNNSGARGSLIENPPARTASLTASDFTAQLIASTSGQQLLALATGDQTGHTPLRCGVDIYYIQYGTVGGANEPTTASGAIYVPTGAAAAGCSGPMPLMLYAHGTETQRAFNMANILAPVDNTIPEVAALYASNGFIVVAPNYAGFDSSTLMYHPYLNADQQSKDMLDALAAARTAITSGKLFSTASENGKVFLMGYSQGGHVAMATLRAMQALGMPPVTASFTGSGPYALAAQIDLIGLGQVNFGLTGLMPLLTASYHNSYKGNTAIGDIYNVTGTSIDAYEDAYAPGIDSLFPGKVSADTLVFSGLFPSAGWNSVLPTSAEITTGVADSGIPAGLQSAVAAQVAATLPSITPIPNNPLSASGFGVNHLWRNTYRVSLIADGFVNPDGLVPVQTAVPFATSTAAHPLRRAAALNDLRGFVPSSTVQLCGGHSDPEVFYPVSTTTMYSFWTSPQVNLPATIAPPPIDVDPGINIPAVSQAAGLAIAHDIGTGVTDPAVFATDINAAVAAALPPSGFVPNPANPVTLLQAGFVQASGLAVASQINGASVTGLIQSTGVSPPFTTATLGPNAGAIAQAVGGQVGLVLTAAYHGNLVEPFCHVAALQFFAPISH